MSTAQNGSPAPGTPAPEGADSGSALSNGQDAEVSGASSTLRDGAAERSHAPVAIGISASDPGLVKPQERAEGQ